MTLCPAPAHAGHWVWNVSGSGQAATNTGRKQTYTAPESAALPIIIPQIAAGDGVGTQFGPGPFPPITANASLSVTVTGTWTTDSNSDNTTPPGIVFSVSSQAQANDQSNGGQLQPGTADDGYGDPVVQTGSSSVIGTSQTPGTKYVPSKAGSCTISLSLSASASGTPGSAGGGSAEANVGPVIIGIEPQPYNFRQTNVTDNGNGTLSFAYAWSSTSGSLADLDPSCLVHEYVTYPGGNPYTPPLPFLLTDLNSGQPAALPNPTITPNPYWKGSVGATPDHQLPWGVTTPYTNQSVVATQTWEFDDSATGQTNQQIPGPDSGPLSITRAVGPRTPPYIGTWYSVTKNGTTAWSLLSRQ